MSQKTTNTKKVSKANLNAYAVTVSDLGIDASKKKERNDVGFATWIRSLLQNWRQGTVSCKGRSDVARTNKKPWKQKGTGRARAGTARSPLWRGGGVTFGPQKRTRTLTVNKGVKRCAMNNLVFDAIEQGAVIRLAWQLEGDKPKTSAAYAALKKADLHEKKVCVFVPMHDALTSASFVNIPNVKVIFFDQANAFDLAYTDYWVCLEKDFDQFKEMVAKWI